MIFPINETILFILHIMLAIVLLKLAVIASGVAYSKIRTYVLVHFRFSQSGFEPVATPNVTVKIKGRYGIVRHTQYRIYIYHVSRFDKTTHTPQIL